MRLLGVAPAALAVLFLAACLGGGSNAGGTTETQAGDQFRRQADAVCRKYEDRLAALGRPKALEDLEGFVAKAVPLIEEGNDELHALTPPAELEADWDAAMEIEDDNLERLRDLQDAVRSDDLTELESITRALEANQAESERLAERLGLHDCGKPAVR